MARGDNVDGVVGNKSGPSQLRAPTLHEKNAKDVIPK